MSRGIDGGPYSEGALLRIRGGKGVRVIYPDGKQQPLWGTSGSVPERGNRMDVPPGYLRLGVPTPGNPSSIRMSGS
jgi:hypothetical protein